MAEDFVVCRADELPPGKRKIVEVRGRSIGVFNINGKYFALRNVCPHQFAPLCEGRVTGTSSPSQVGEYLYGREGEIICCPWHGWEFDILTGRSIFNPHKVRVKTYEVTVEPSCEGCEEEPSVETFPVTIRDDVVVLHV